MGRALRCGAARCCNGIVDAKTIDILSLSNSTDRLEHSLKDLTGVLNRSTSSSNSSSSSSCSSSNSCSSNNSSSSPTKAPATAVRRKSAMRVLEGVVGSDSGHIDVSSLLNSFSTKAKDSSEKTISLIEHLLISAKVVVKIRSLIKFDQLEAAGVTSENAVSSGSVHQTVFAELNLYATEINKALQMMNICKKLKDAIKLGNVETLADCIYDASSELRYDLGLLVILEKAQNCFFDCANSQERLLKLAQIYEIKTIQLALDNFSVKAKIPGLTIERARHRIAQLTNFNSALIEVHETYGGTFAGERSYQRVLAAARDLNLTGHPVARAAQVFSVLTEMAEHAALVAAAASTGSSFVAASQTIPLKRAFLSLPSSEERFQLENFGGWRSITDFGMNAIVDAGSDSKAKVKMLEYTDLPLPTSLTVLPPPLAALAIWIFSHNIRGIERNLYSHPEVFY